MRLSTAIMDSPKMMMLRAVEELAGVTGIIGGSAYLAGKMTVLQSGLVASDAAFIAIVISSISAGVGVISARILEAYRGFLRANDESAHAKLAAANKMNHELADRNSSLERSAASMASTIESQQRTIFEQQLQIDQMRRSKENALPPHQE